METLPRRLEMLEQALAALPEASDAMTLGELDGFIAGILVCPVEIPMEEWTSLLWRERGEDGAPLPMAPAVRDALRERILHHHRRTGLQLRAAEEGYAPIVYTEAESQDVHWDSWASGFGEAMQGRMDSWEAVAATGDTAAIDALAGLSDLVRIATRADHGAELNESDSALQEEAPDLIPVWVETLFDWRLAYRPDPVQVPIRTAKIGRNDPCPCGSGKKYKKCCGIAEAA